MGDVFSTSNFDISSEDRTVSMSSGENCRSSLSEN